MFQFCFFSSRALASGAIMTHIELRSQCSCGFPSCFFFFFVETDFFFLTISKPPIPVKFLASSLIQNENLNLASHEWRWLVFFPFFLVFSVVARHPAPPLCNSTQAHTSTLVHSQVFQVRLVFLLFFLLKDQKVRTLTYNEGETIGTKSAHISYHPITTSGPIWIL